jgi:hypothetical protein
MLLKVLGVIVSVLAGFTAAELDLLVKSGDEEALRLLAAAADPMSLCGFEPRPDSPGDYDEQTSFLDDWESDFAILLGGNGSGKTVVAAQKTARYVLTRPPQRPRLQFWIIGEKLDQVGAVCWGEKLSRVIPESCILDISWHDSKAQYPKAVFLKHPTIKGEVGWILQFKSYEQGVGSMKAHSIGGFWCNEEIPYSMVFEIQARCRDYGSPGWADFTPIECKGTEWPDAYEKPPEGWKFYHLNTLKNDRLAPGFMEKLLKNCPEDQRETRTIGKFSSLRGAVYKEFRKSIHVIKPFRIPHDWRKIRGLDFGFNNPTGCLCVARDHDGRYFVYDEHYQAQTTIADHVKAINRRAWDYNSPNYGPTYSDHDAQCRGEYTIAGIPCTPARKAKLPGINLLRSLMMVQEDQRPMLQIFEGCEHLIEELIGYRWPEGTTGKNPRDEPLDKDDHLCDALRYAIFSDHHRGDEKSIDAKFVLPDHRRFGVQFSRGG